jgi:hypothetical protein
MKSKIIYRGFSIEKEVGLFVVRRYYRKRHGRRVMHDWKSWANSIDEAKAIVDKLIARAEFFEMAAQYERIGRKAK